MPVQKAAHSSSEIVFRHFENVVESWRREETGYETCSHSQILAVSNENWYLDQSGSNMCVKSEVANVDVKNKYNTIVTRFKSPS